MKRPVLILLPLAAVAWLGGCSSPTESDPEFDVTLTVDPDPANAGGPTGVLYKVTNPDDSVSYYEYDWRTTFTVRIQENAGMALDITQLNATVQQATGGIVIPPSGGDSVYYKFTSTAAVNHINASGAADVGFDVFYDLPNLKREALITVSFTFKYTDEDDNEYTYAKTLDVKVAP
jgi:hypothetical protein